MPDKMIPFGKHKGKPIEAILDDHKYREWLLAQSWFKDQHTSLYTIVINNGQEPVDTPEHNAMQIRFLSEEFRLKFALATEGAGVFEFTTNTAAREVTVKANEIRDGVIEGYRQKERSSDVPQISIEGVREEFGNSSAQRTNKLIICGEPKFETKGRDVDFKLWTGFRFSPWGLDTAIWNGGGHYEKVYLPDHAQDYRFIVEIKPTISDDYPAVLRQMKQSESKYLLLRSYTGVGVSEEQFVDFFKSQGITVIFEHEVDAITLPKFDRELE